MIGTSKELAKQTFREEIADLLLSFNEKDVFEALDAWELVYGGSESDDIDNIVVGLESAFVVLVNRGAIQRVRPLSTAGIAQWERLIDIYRI